MRIENMTELTVPDKDDVFYIVHDPGGTPLARKIKVGTLREHFNVMDYGAVGDGTTDDTAAINAAVAACPVGGTVFFPACAGGYKITSTVTIEDRNLSFAGEMAPIKIALTDTGTDGLVIRHGPWTGASAYAYQTVENLSVIGGASCCRHAVVLQQCNGIKADITNIAAGATGYGLRIYGTIYGDVRANLLAHGTGLTYARPTNGILIDIDPTDPPGVSQTNVLRLVTHIQNGSSGTGITIDGSYSSLYVHNIDISGSIEWTKNTSYPIHASYARFLNLHDLYMAEGNRAKCLFEDCSEIRIGPHVYFANDLDDGSNDLDFQDCGNVVIRESECDGIAVDGDCGLVTIGQTKYTAVSGDGAARVVYTGPRYTGYDYYSGGDPGYAPINLASNGSFSAWSGGNPTGWDTTNITWTQCGSGKADTTVHGELYSGLATFTGNADLDPSLDSNVLNLLKGKYVSVSIWAKLASGQFAGGGTRPYLSVEVTSTGAGALSRSDSLTAGDEDAWHLLHVGVFVPDDATALDIHVYGYQATGPANVDCYFSELVVTPGVVAPRNWIVERGVNGTEILDDGANWRVTRVYRDGKVVSITTAASSGAAATWTAD